MQIELSNDCDRPGGVRDAPAQMFKRAGRAVTLLCLFAANLMLASCGGSGGGGSDNAGAGPVAVVGASSQTVSGVAATGAPLIGQVTLRDSSGVRSEKVTDINKDGSFAIDVTDMTAPYILKATGTADGVSRTLFSFADKPGIANINQLSTVAVAHAAGVDDPAMVFDAPDSAALDRIKSAMPASMPASVATLRSQLKPLLAAFSADNTDPVKDHFAADHTGLDGAFDSMKVVLAGGTVAITNVDTGAPLFSARVTELEHGSFTAKSDDIPTRGPRPAAPTGVNAVGGDGQVTVAWDPVANATSYDLYYATKPKVAEEEDRDSADVKRVRNVTSPYVITGLAASTTYSVMLRARIGERRGPASDEVSATTTGTTPPPTTTTTGGSTTTTTAAATTTTTAPATTTTARPTTTTTTAAPTTTTTTARPTTTTTTAAPTTTTTTAAPTTTTTTAAPTTTTTTARPTTTTTTAAPTTTTTTAPPTTTTTTARPTTTTTTAAPTTTTTTAAPTTTTTTAAPTTTTTTTTATTTTTTLAPPLNGATLYLSAGSCIGCHGGSLDPANSSHVIGSDKQGADAALITSAIANVSSMRSRFNATTGTVFKLTPAQISAIAAALQ